MLKNNALNMKIKLSFKIKNNNKFLIFSLPQSNHYQKISNLTITPKNYQIINEKKWGNKIVILNSFQDLKKLNIFFNHQPLKIKKTMNPNYTLKSYDFNKIPKLYLTPNRFINGKDQQIKKLSQKIVGQEKNLYQIIKKLYDFSLNYLTYGKPIDGLYTYKQALTEKITDCGGFSTFLASFLQSQKIPSRLVVGFIIKKNFFKNFLNKLHVIRYTLQDLLMHAWLEIILPDGSWFPLDPSIEWRRNNGLSKRQGGFGFIPADRLITSFGCNFNIKIGGTKYNLSILQNKIII